MLRSNEEADADEEKDYADKWYNRLAKRWFPSAAGWELTAIGQATSDTSIREVKSRIKREHI